jgi:hypothetical protein
MRINTIHDFLEAFSVELTDNCFISKFDDGVKPVCMIIKAAPD